MNAKNVRLWIQELRSGKYKQGHFALAARNGEDVRYCCLGVACEAYQKKGPGDLVIGSDGDFVTYDGRTGFLPEKVRSWLGCVRTTGSLLPSHKPLTTMNDIYKDDFNKIADYIEKCLEDELNIS